MQALQFASLTTYPLNLDEEVKVQVCPILPTGFVCGKECDDTRTLSQKTKWSSKQASSTLQPLRKLLSETHEIGSKYLVYFPGMEWDTWVYNCRAKNSLDDCIAVIKVQVLTMY